MKDMTYDEVLAFIAAHPHGTAEVTASGLDVSQIRAALQMTPTERLRDAVRLTNLTLRLHTDQAGESNR